MTILNSIIIVLLAFSSIMLMYRIKDIEGELDALQDRAEALDDLHDKLDDLHKELDGLITNKK